jgi:hypothetical protein
VAISLVATPTAKERQIMKTLINKFRNRNNKQYPKKYDIRFTKIIDKFRNKKPVLDCKRLVAEILFNPSFRHSDNILSESHGIKKYFHEFRMEGKVLPRELHWSYIDVDTGIHTGRLQRLTNQAKINTVIGELFAMKVILTESEQLLIQIITNDLRHHLDKIKNLKGKKYSVALEQKLNS